MNTFPYDGDVAATRNWLDGEGFMDVFMKWKANMLLCASRDDVFEELLQDAPSTRRLWTLLEEARRDRDRDRDKDKYTSRSLTAPFKELVACALNKPAFMISEHTMSRMIKRYFGEVYMSWMSNDLPTLAGAYKRTERLPRTATCAEIQEHLGFILNEETFYNNEKLLLCFRNMSPYVLKICQPAEYERAIHFRDILKEEPCEWIISYELLQRGDSNFMFMPMYPTTLEQLPHLDEITLPVFWHCLSSALDYLHSKKYAHNDMKPSNILIISAGTCILGDLGSLVPFDTRSSSTCAYHPRELWDKARNCGPPASSVVDYWMLSMVIYEKACGGNIQGPESPLMQEILDKIRSTGICNDIYPRLEDYLNIS